MSYNSLIDILVNVLIFFELSDDDAVNQDVAVGMLESIAEKLQSASPEVLHDVQTRIREAVDSNSTWTVEDRNRILSLGPALGLWAGSD